MVVVRPAAGQPAAGRQRARGPPQLKVTPGRSWADDVRGEPEAPGRVSAWVDKARAHRVRLPPVPFREGGRRLLYRGWTSLPAWRYRRGLRGGDLQRTAPTASGGRAHVHDPPVARQVTLVLSRGPAGRAPGIAGSARRRVRCRRAGCRRQQWRGAPAPPANSVDNIRLRGTLLRHRIAGAGFCRAVGPTKGPVHRPRQ